MEGKFFWGPGMGLTALFLMLSITAISADVSSGVASWTFTSIDVPGADQTYARDMNQLGQIVGHYAKSASGEFRGYLLNDGVFTPIVVGDFNDARGINPAGEIVGWFVSSIDGFALHGYLLTKGKVMQIDYPGADYTLAEALNAAGDVVGFYGMSGTEHGFLRRGGVLSTIDYPGATLTNARGINSEGEIVGLYTDDQTSTGRITASCGRITAPLSQSMVRVCRAATRTESMLGARS